MVEDAYEVIILDAGPAGLQAAIHAVRSKISVLVFGKQAESGRQAECRALDPESMQYIDTNKKQETNIPGIYAAGDICGPPWQVAIAVGQGAMAGIEAASYAKRHR